MGLFDKLRGELIDIVEWIDDTNHTLVWRFPRYQNEIKNGAQLVVREGQKAIFVKEGKLADVFEPGRHILETKNLPLLSTLMGWKYGFNSPFKAEVYFVSTKQVTDLKWGTENPVMMRDPEMGPISLRAFGTYALQATEPRALLRQLVGTDGVYETGEVSELMKGLIISAFSQLLGEAKIAAFDLAGNLRGLSEKLRLTVRGQIDDEYGLDLPQLMIVNVSLPEKAMKALETRMSMEVLGNMQKFQQFQAGEAMLAAAQNPSGGLGVAGAGLGLGVAMMGQTAQAMAPAQAAPAQAAPPPLPPPGSVWHVAVGGQTQGPIAESQLIQSIAEGRVTPTTLVWSPAIGSWTPAGQVSQLAGHFRAPPPPPPTT